MGTPASAPIDDRLRELLAVEQRLQSRVAAAREAAAERVREARDTAERHLTDAAADVAEACAAEARADQARHAAALAEIDAAHDAVMTRLGRVADADIEALARRVLARLREDLGGAP